jgi:hypothetical protein
MSAALTLKKAMRDQMLSRLGLGALLGGAHVYDELPRGVNAPFAYFAEIETRDWSVIGQKAHEHFITINVVTNERGRTQAEMIAYEIELALDGMPLTLEGYRLINLHLTFGTVSRDRKTQDFGASLRFRATTEPTST